MCLLKETFKTDNTIINVDVSVCLSVSDYKRNSLGLNF